MNIFVLDYDIKTAASYHCKQHLTKMPLEAAQMLSTVCRQHGDDSGYKSTHVHHPCTVWTGASLDNWEWLRELAIEMDLYKRSHVDVPRHKAVDKILQLKKPKGLKSRGLTEFAQTMPEECRAKDAVQAYRTFYHTKLFSEWFEVPEWIDPQAMYKHYIDQALANSCTLHVGEAHKMVYKNSVVKGYLKSVLNDPAECNLSPLDLER